MVPVQRALAVTRAEKLSVAPFAPIGFALCFNLTTVLFYAFRISAIHTPLALAVFILANIEVRVLIQHEFPFTGHGLDPGRTG
jgi:hypothetical protein